MANLYPYFENGVAPGVKRSIWAQIVFFYNVGSGCYTGFSDYGTAFSGMVNCVFYEGPLDLSMELTDHDPGATAGPVNFSVNGAQATEASYVVQNSQLVVKAVFADGKNIQATFERSGDGKETYISLNGAYSVNIHLAPA